MKYGSYITVEDSARFTFSNAIEAHEGALYRSKYTKLTVEVRKFGRTRYSTVARYRDGVEVER